MSIVSAIDQYHPIQAERSECLAGRRTTLQDSRSQSEVRLLLTESVRYDQMLGIIWLSIFSKSQPKLEKTKVHKGSYGPGFYGPWNSLEFVGSLGPAWSSHVAVAVVTACHSVAT